MGEGRGAVPISVGSFGHRRRSSARVCVRGSCVCVCACAWVCVPGCACISSSLHHQVAPAELEGLLINHPGVDDVGVVGVPDREAGELPRAFIVRKPGKRVSERDIHDYVDGAWVCVRVCVRVCGVCVRACVCAGVWSVRACVRVCGCVECGVCACVYVRACVCACSCRVLRQNASCPGTGSRAGKLWVDPAM